MVWESIKVAWCSSMYFQTSFKSQYASGLIFSLLRLHVLGKWASVKNAIGNPTTTWWVRKRRKVGKIWTHKSHTYFEWKWRRAIWKRSLFKGKWPPTAWWVYFEMISFKYFEIKNNQLLTMPSSLSSKETLTCHSNFAINFMGCFGFKLTSKIPSILLH